MRGQWAWVLAACVGIACSGKTAGDTPDGGGGGNGDGATCVNVDLTTYDRSCTTGSDCIAVTGGEVCNGDCHCGGTAAINASGEARYQQATAGIQPGACFCPMEPLPECVDGLCTLPGSGSVGGDDAGTTSVPESGAAGDDAGDTSVADTGAADAARCVDVDPATYDQSCKQDSDCTLVAVGMLCTGACACTGGAIAVDGLGAYRQATQSVQTAACPCAFAGTPRCVGGTCALCTPSGANCPDGG